MGGVEKQLASERVIVASPMSMAGAWGRAMRLRDCGGPQAGTLERTIWTCVAVTIGTLWAVAALAWTILMFLVFGVFFIAYRLLRRSSRKRKAEQLRHRETLAMLERRP